MPPLESPARTAPDSFHTAPDSFQRASQSSQGSYLTSPPGPESQPPQSQPPPPPPPTSPSPSPSQLQSQSQSESQDEWWEISCILDQRQRSGRREYKVDWAPHPVTGQTYDPEWKPTSEVTSAALQEWALYKKQKQKQKHKQSRRTRNQNERRRQSRNKTPSTDAQRTRSASRSSRDSVSSGDSPFRPHSRRPQRQGGTDRFAPLNCTATRGPVLTEQPAVCVSCGSRQVSPIAVNLQAPIGEQPPAIGASYRHISATAVTTPAKPRLADQELVTLESPHETVFLDITASQSRAPPPFQRVSIHQDHQDIIEIPDSQDSSEPFVASPSHISLGTDLPDSQPQHPNSLCPSTFSYCETTSQVALGQTQPSTHSPFSLSVSQHPAQQDKSPASRSIAPATSLPELPRESQTPQNYVFLSQIAPRFQSGSGDSIGLLATFRSPIKSLGIDHITDTPYDPTSQTQLPTVPEWGVKPQDNPASVLMGQLPPRSTHSLRSTENGHKRTLSSPGSHPLVKRTRAFEGKKSAIMDLDDSMPLSSVDDLLNMQTPYDPARPIIVTADEIESSVKLSEDVQKGGHDLSMQFSLLQNSETLLPPALPSSIVSEAPSNPMVSACDTPMISGAVSPSVLDFNSARNINANMMLPQQNPSLLTIAPSDISRSIDVPFEDHLRESPHLNTSPVQPPVKESTVESLQSLEGDILYDGEREFLITLPFASNQRPLYIDIIEKFKAYNKSFSKIFFNEKYEEPRASLVHQIDEEFVTLLDLCDYPHELASKSLSDLSEKEIQHYAVESNAKFNFLWEFLHELEETENEILIVVRSEKLLQLLKAVISAEKIPVSTSTLDEADYSRSTSSLTVVLALHNSEIKDPISSFNVVIGFDYMFQSSATARQIEALPTGKQPFVLTLMMLHSIEHLHISISKARDPMEHKNAVVYGLVEGRDLIRNPRLADYEKPHEIAFHFAEQVKDPNPHFAWDSQPFPKEILEGIYMSPQSSENTDVDTGSDTQATCSRKRKHINDHIKSSKRLKTSDSAPPPSNLLVDADRHAAIAPFVKILGLHVLDVANAWNGHEVSVPGRLLTAMCQKAADDQLAISKERGVVTDLRNVVKSLNKHVTGYSMTLEQEGKRLREALEERAKSNIERDAISKENESLKAQLQSLQNQIQASREEEKRSEAAALAVDNSVTPPDASNVAIVEATQRAVEAEANAASLEKRYASQSTEMDYFRQAYQDASNAASTLRKENTSLTQQLQESQRCASDNLLHIHEINTQAQTVQLTRMLHEARTVQREREADLERVRDELRVYKNSRRETRQSSAPRSPRVGMMSPRTAGFRGPAPSSSRGTSPATLDGCSGSGGGAGSGGANMQYFNSQQTGNGRWGHLKD
ncbi:hypothetical protein BROUX41_004619 [Berkeleyomyces rouxiae]